MKRAPLREARFLSGSAILGARVNRQELTIPRFRYGPLASAKKKWCNFGCFRLTVEAWAVTVGAPALVIKRVCCDTIGRFYLS